MDPATDPVYRTKRTRKEGEMEPNEIRERVSSMWLTTPESELLGCIALTLAEMLDAIRAGNAVVPAAVFEQRIPARIAS